MRFPRLPRGWGMGERQVAWTDAQREAIEARGVGLLVSASAGTGKTAVLAERCVSLVADGRRPCRIDQLLVVTFTDAAAAEMRGRIGQALAARLADRPTDRRLAQQLALIDGAHISTIHAFCLEVLRKHFCQAGLDPTFAVLDADEAELLKQETLEALFAELYAAQTELGERFRRLVELYGDGLDEAVGRFVLGLHGLLGSLVLPQQWLEAAAAAAKPGSAALGELFAAQLVDELSMQMAQCRAEAAFIRSHLSAWSVYAEGIEEYAGQVARWLGKVRAGEGGLEEVLAEIGQYKFPLLPRKRTAKGESDADRAWAADVFKLVRDRYFRERLREGYALVGLEEAAEQLGETAPFVEALCQIVGRFVQDYGRAKDRLAVVDFDDLQQRCLDLLTADRQTLAPSEVAGELQRHFEHVLVDEYQDINPVQDAILRLVSREQRADEPSNLFAVGDVKQSIYRFRLAEPEIFLARQKMSRSSDQSRVREVALRENFRSRASVLEMVNMVFGRLMAGGIARIEYDERACLVPGLDYPETKAGDVLDRPAAELHVLPRARRSVLEEQEEAEEEAPPLEAVEREAYVVGRRILELMGREGAKPVRIWHRQDGEWQARPLRYRDVVVLLRTVRHQANHFAAVLRRMGIPVFAEQAGGYFESMEVRDVLGLLSLLDNQQQDIPLAGVMRGPLLEVPFCDSELVAIRSVDGRVPFHEAVRAYAKRGDDSVLRERVVEFLSMLERWRTISRQRPVAELLWQLYEETGYLDYVGGMPDGAQRRANLLGLYERARQFGQFAKQGLFRFLRFIDQLAERDRVVESPTPLSEAEDVVRVMSIHRSKGLEFPVVIVPQLGKRFNFSDARGSMIVDRRTHVGLKVMDEERGISYPTLAHRLVSRQMANETRAEELRVLYVALTRAQQRLILIGTVEGGLADPRLRWAGHEGALPEAVLATANCPLDWLVPALGCERGERVVWGEHEDAEAGAGSLVRVERYGVEEVAGWRMSEEGGRGTPRGVVERVAALEPLAEGATPDGRVEGVIERITARYGHESLTRLPAVISVSELKRRYLLAWEPGEQVDSYLGSTWLRQPQPRFVQVGAAEPDGAARGVATHAVMQHVDLARPCDRADLAAQVSAMVAGGLLGREQADWVDLASVAWFFETELGRRLRACVGGIRRELPFVARLAPDEYEAGLACESWAPADAILVRGIVDCVLEEGGGVEVIDYKSDQVVGEQLAERVEAYRPQLAIYAEALSKIWGWPVRRCWAVFLAARHIELIER